MEIGILDTNYNNDMTVSKLEIRTTTIQIHDWRGLNRILRIIMGADRLRSHESELVLTWNPPISSDTKWNAARRSRYCLSRIRRRHGVSATEMTRIGIFFLEKSKSPTVRSGRRGPRGRTRGTGDRRDGKRKRRYRWTMVEAAASILSSPLSPTSSSSTTLSSSGRLLHAIAYSQPCHYHEAILHAG